MNDDQKTVFGCIGIALSVLGLWIVSVLLEAWALTKLWGWFVVTTFGAPSIGIAAAIGLSCLINLTHPVSSNQKDDGETNWARVFGLTILRPLFAVFFGWIAYQFMVK